MNHLMPGETLAISDRVAMMPTVQPAAAGTHGYRDARRVNVAVIGREDIRSKSEIVVTTRLPDRSGVLLAGPLAGFVGYGAGFPECQLQRFQPVAHRPGVRAEVFGGGG